MGICWERADLSACAVLLFAVLIFCVPFSYGLGKEDVEFDCIGS